MKVNKLKKRVDVIEYGDKIQIRELSLSRVVIRAMIQSIETGRETESDGSAKKHNAALSTAADMRKNTISCRCLKEFCLSLEMKLKDRSMKEIEDEIEENLVNLKKDNARSIAKKLEMLEN
jgi:hypothetical protein